MKTRLVLVLAVGFLLTGCAILPPGPSVMVLPGTGKEFDEFSYDDAVCRQWALQQSGTTTTNVWTDATVSGAAIGTALGAASGAAIGAAAGNPAIGAAVGAGVGLLGGTAVGADSGAGAQWSVQRRYDASYMQCMYAKGNQIPMPAGFQPTQAGVQSNGPPPRVSTADIPPPPAGRPPPPPPDDY